MKGQVEEQQQLSQQQFIRRHGYELAPASPFTLPTASNPTSLIKSLLRIFIQDDRQKAIFNPQAPKHISVLNDKQAIIYHSNKLTVIKYSLKEEGFHLESKACFLLNWHIKRVVCGFIASRQEKSDTFDHFAVHYQSSPSISLFRVDHHTATLSHDFKESDRILAIRFVSSNEVVIVQGNGRVNGYSIREGRLRKAKGNLKILLEDDQALKNAELCTAGSGNQAKILLFYLLHSRKHQKYTLHLKEYLHEGTGQLQQLGTFYDIFDSQTLSPLSQAMPIFCFGDGILIQQGLTINVLQKRFGKYARSDVISQLSAAKRISIIERGQHIFICSFGQGEVELWQVLMKEVGCSLKLLDVIQADGEELARKLIKAWIFVQGKKPQFVMAADAGHRQVDFFLTKKLDKLAKLTGRVRREERKLQVLQQIGRKSAFALRLRQMEQLGGKLGFRRREFYLKLWRQSQKNYAHIAQFLLACKDFKVIFNQLCLFLRVKKLTVTQIIRILKRIQQSLLQQLTHSLELQLIRQFLKTNFQRRKLKLYSGQVQLDFQQYQDIYEASLFDMLQRSIDLRLFPDKFKHDIVWKEQTIQKPIEIPYILREFRLLILQDYPGFLKKLLMPYGVHLRAVVQAYPYLLPQFPLKISVIRQQLVMLSNIYQAQKIEEQQYSWLGYIRENQWQRQTSSLDFLHRHLFAHHPTSLIADKLRQFTEGPWCHRHKYSRHVLLEARRKEFQQKLPAISDGSSLLFLCEWANRLALQSGTPSDSTALVQAMHKHNHLPLTQYYRYRLYCTLHYMLIQQQLLHTSTTIFELLQLAPEKLVACFFLGNRERIGLLFQKVSKEYPSKGAFNSMVEAFVGSGECSKVELEMLTNYLRRAGEHYQQENQELIGIVLRGFMKRIQVRQKDKALDFLQLFRSISLTQTLLITLALFQTVKADCSPILKLFNLSSLTYQTVIHDPRTVITSITHEYFSNAGVRLRSIYIQGREVSLSFPQNLFVVVLYLKDKIYSYGQEMELYLIFSEAVLGWNQFDLIRDCFSQDILIDDQEYLPEEFAALVVDYMLNKYYEDESLQYCTETTDHIHHLLSLIDETAPVAVVQLAKMDFVQALQPLGQSIGVQYMEMVRQQWEKQEQRVGLFRDIVDLFPIIQWSVAVQLYSCLQRMRTGRARVQVKTDEFVQMALYICGKYVKQGQFQRICEVISFLNEGEVYYRAKYSFMIECFLQVLHDRLQTPHQLRHSYLKVDRRAELATCKRLIDYFLSHFTHIDSITHFFASKFQLPAGDTPDEIEIDAQLCLPASSHQLISREAIWELIVKRAISSSETFTRKEVRGNYGHHDAGSNALDTRTILFTYCFTCNVLHDSHYLFQLDDISFRHLENVQVLAELAKQDGMKSTINFKSLYRQYLKGLFKIYVLMCDTQGTPSTQQDELPVLQKRMSLDDDVKIREIRNMEDSQLILLIADLPMEKGQLELVRAMKKLSALFQNTSFPPQEKPIRMTTVKTIPELSQHSLPLYFQAQGGLKQSVTQMHLGLPSQHLQTRTFRFLQFQKVKKQIASKTSMVSQKLIIGKVLDQLENQPQLLQMNAEMPEDSFLEEKITINRMMAPREWENEEEIGHVLQEINMEKSAEMIALDLSGIHSLEENQTQVDPIRQLLQIKDYHKIIEQFPTKAILKAIDAEFYQRAETAPRPRKRIMRSNTLKQSILNSKIIALLEALDGLKLYGSSAKPRLLRSCLTTISSEELQSVQGNLLGVFKLNILLDVSKNTQNMAKLILQHAKESCAGIQLARYKTIVKIIESFIKKCREQARVARHSSKAIPSGHEAAELYCEYLIRLASSDRPQDQKHRQLSQIMALLTKEDLLSIHQRLSSALSEGELYIPYLQLIHTLYVGVAS